MARVLPGPGDDAPQHEPSPLWMHREGAGDSVLTTLGDRAADDHHERPPIH